MDKHTDGPWRLKLEHLREQDGQQYDNYVSIEAGRGCLGDIDSPMGFGLSGFMKDADAHLIVAAPDMYESLKEAIAMIQKVRDNSVIADRPQDVCPSDEADAMIAKCEAAIKKAGGE